MLRIMAQAIESVLLGSSAICSSNEDGTPEMGTSLPLLFTS